MTAKPCSRKNESSYCPSGAAKSGAVKTPTSRASELRVVGLTDVLPTPSHGMTGLGEHLDAPDATVVGELEGEALGGAQRRPVDLDRLRQLGERERARIG